MTNKTTFRTEKLSLTERHLHDSSTFTTGFACVSGIDFNQLRTACDSFVFQVPDESTPRGISYVFSEMMIMNHIIDTQVFNGNSTIIESELSTNFVQEVSSLIGNFDMFPSQLESSFSPVSRTFDLFAQPSLKELQSIFTLDEMPWISYDFTIGESSKVLNTYIQPHLFIGLMLNNRSIDLTTKYSKPLSSIINLESERLNLSSRKPVKNNGNVSYLGSIQSPVVSELETTLREDNTVHSTLESWKTLFLTSRVFYSPKEAIKSLREPIRDILQDLRVDFFSNRRTAAFQIHNKGVKVILFGYEKFLVQIKKSIVNIFAMRKIINESYLLLSRRVDSVLIHPKFHTIYQAQLVYKTIGRSRI